jgi:hypothetical protein
MSKKIDNGGAAFPHKAKHYDSDCGGYVYSLDHHEPGMTLRDYFAAAALTGLMNRDSNQRSLAEQDVEYCFAIADAMIKARKGGDQP